MSLTASNMLALGTPAPDFALPDAVSGATLNLGGLRSRQATVVMFICNHCPYVKHVNPELVRLARDYLPKSVSFIAISANDAKAYPEDAPERMRDVARQVGYPFAYLHDETQEVARSYRAACTPDFYVFDGALKLAYRGRLDDSTPGNGRPLTGIDLRGALDAVLAGLPASTEQKPSLGCNIKWKK